MELLEINNTIFKTPSKFKPSIMYIKEASRNSANATLKQKVKGKKRKIECTWAYLTEDEMQTLLVLCDNNGLDEVNLKYYDSEEKAIKTGTFYANDRNPEIWKFLNDKAEYLNFSLSFIEF
jgi:hypothetical protein